MNLSVTARFLWLPVRRAGPAVKLHFLSEGVKFQEVDIVLDPDHPDYFAAMDVGRFAGKTVEILGLPDGAEKSLRLCDSRPAADYPYRPEIHFTAPSGWINDPNGLVYAGGVWHLYHQWNPYGTEWGNMHWGHAVSRDLILWEHRGVALEPDICGTVYSGSGWQDRAGDAGFGLDALLFFYTASGGCNQWSAEAGNLFTQRLAVSADNGETLRKAGLILDHIKGGNRDPKVFYHRESRAYVMVLYLDDYDFALFRSEDLLHWKETQRFSAPKMWECPDLFELPVVNQPGRKKWVFRSADGYCLIGDFDGFRFSPETDVLPSWEPGLPYAAQTYAGVEGRTVSIAWLRTACSRGNFRGMMSVPAELSLIRKKKDYRLHFQPVREIWDRFRPCPESAVPSGVRTSGKPLILKVSWKPGEPREINVGGETVRVNAEGSEALFLLDHGVAEYWADDGLVCGALEISDDALFRPSGIRTGGAVTEMYEFCRE